MSNYFQERFAEHKHSLEQKYATALNSGAVSYLALHQMALMLSASDMFELMEREIVSESGPAPSDKAVATDWVQIFSAGFPTEYQVYIQKQSTCVENIRHCAKELNDIEKELATFGQLHQQNLPPKVWADKNREQQRLLEKRDTLLCELDDNKQNLSDLHELIQEKFIMWCNYVALSDVSDEVKTSLLGYSEQLPNYKTTLIRSIEDIQTKMHSLYEKSRQVIEKHTQQPLDKSKLAANPTIQLLLKAEDLLEDILNHDFKQLESLQEHAQTVHVNNDVIHTLQKIQTDLKDFEEFFTYLSRACKYALLANSVTTLQDNPDLHAENTAHMLSELIQEDLTLSDVTTRPPAHLDPALKELVSIARDIDADFQHLHSMIQHNTMDDVITDFVETNEAPMDFGELSIQEDVFTPSEHVDLPLPELINIFDTRVENLCALITEKQQNLQRTDETFAKTETRQIEDEEAFMQQQYRRDTILFIHDTLNLFDSAKLKALHGQLNMKASDNQANAHLRGELSQAILAIDKCSDDIIHLAKESTVALNQGTPLTLSDIFNLKGMFELTLGPHAKSLDESFASLKDTIQALPTKRRQTFTKQAAGLSQEEPSPNTDTAKTSPRNTR